MREGLVTAVTLEEILDLACDLAASRLRRCPRFLRDASLSSCPCAEDDHADDPRVFAHVFCRPEATICVAEALDGLSDGHKLGVLLHELGHLATNGDDADADLWVHEAVGVDLEYRETRGAPGVQWVDPSVIG